MKPTFGSRKADIARREISIISWLGSQESMTWNELTGLFTEGVENRYTHPVRLLTHLALDSLRTQGIVLTTTREVQGASFEFFGLADPSAADELNPNDVELTLREMSLLCFMDNRRDEVQTAIELAARVGRLTEFDFPQTEACLAHLAKLGLIDVVETPPGAYILSTSS